MARLTKPQREALALGAADATGYVPGRSSVKRALMLRGLIDWQHRITPSGRKILAESQARSRGGMRLTSVNRFVLGELFPGPVRACANAITSVDMPHVRRLYAMGYVEILDRRTLVITDAGIAALVAVGKWRAE